MPLQYKPSKNAFYTEGDSLTEQEHKDSCDVNKMIHSAHKGLQVRGSKHKPQYGYDDTTVDAVTFHIQKEEAITGLHETASKNEFESKDLEKIPEDVRKKFGFKKKKSQNEIDYENHKKELDEEFKKTGSFKKPNQDPPKT